MRALSCWYESFNTGMLAIIETAIPCLFLLGYCSKAVLYPWRTLSGNSNSLYEYLHATRVCLLVRMIRRAHQRTRFHVTETHAKRLFLHELELFRRVIAGHRQVV